MGLDVVEIVMQCEETFGVKLEDARLERVATAGDLFELVCEQLGLPFGDGQPRPSMQSFVRARPALYEPWTRDEVWSRLVRVVVDQLQVDESEVRYVARFQDDLGAD